MAPQHREATSYATNHRFFGIEWCELVVRNEKSIEEYLTILVKLLSKEICCNKVEIATIAIRGESGANNLRICIWVPKIGVEKNLNVHMAQWD